MYCIASKIPTASPSTSPDVQVLSLSSITKKMSFKLILSTAEFMLGASVLNYAKTRCGSLFSHLVPSNQSPCLGIPSPKSTKDSLLLNTNCPKLRS